VSDRVIERQPAALPASALTDRQTDRQTDSGTPPASVESWVRTPAQRRGEGQTVVQRLSLIKEQRRNDRAGEAHRCGSDQTAAARYTHDDEKLYTIP
jgi:hypothetical protein